MVGHLPIGQREHPVRVAILGPMADAQAGGPAREHRPRKPTDGHGRLLIKRRFHLIEQQHGRSCGEGPQQRHPSKLAARELSRRVIERHAIEHRQESISFSTSSSGFGEPAFTFSVQGNSRLSRTVPGTNDAA